MYKNPYSIERNKFKNRYITAYYKKACPQEYAYIIYDILYITSIHSTKLI